MDESLPEGFSSWAEVPDALVPVTKVNQGPNNLYTTIRKHRFVKGPLSVGWLAAVSASGHQKAIWVALALKSRTDVEREEWVTPPYGMLGDFNVSRVDLCRALLALERADLVKVQRRKGRPSLVRLCKWEDGGDG